MTVFLQNIYKYTKNIYKKAVLLQIYIIVKKQLSYGTVFFTQRYIYICVCVMILRFLFFIQTFLNYCKALSTETYKRYVNILLLLL